MKNKNYTGFLWHAIFLSLTTTFTDVNTIIPSLILTVGGSAIHVGIVSAIVIGLPIVTKLFFSSFLSAQEKKKPYLLLGINLRIIALMSIALTLMWYKNLSFIVILLLLYGELLIFSVGGAFASLPYIYLLGTFTKETRIKFFTRRPMISSVGMLLSVISARYILSQWKYPTQYVILFALSAASLLIASFGFRMIKERSIPATPKKAIGKILKDLPHLFAHDKNFFIFIIYSNIMGAALALIPFYIAYAKNSFTVNSTMLGYILFVQIIGMFLASFIFPKIIKKRGFKGVLTLRIVIHSGLPLLALFVAEKGSLLSYLSVFFIVGFALSARAASEDAALIELTDEKNRVLYSALAGTLNIAIIIFPFILGLLITKQGYVMVFLLSSLITIGAFPVLKSLQCPVDNKKLSSPHTTKIF